MSAERLIEENISEKIQQELKNKGIEVCYDSFWDEMGICEVWG